MLTQHLKPIAILGAGSWGTALALYLARRQQTVNLWSIEPQEIAAMLAEKTNNRYLAGFSFPETIHPLSELDLALHPVQDILIAVPSIGLRPTLNLCQPLLKPGHRIICVTKGLDEQTGQLANEIVQDVLGDRYPFAVLSGPSFAKEVAAGLPTAVVIASHHRPFVDDLIVRFHSPRFRISASDDVVGVEIGGAVKNVIAIATGISDGMQFGTNARSALISFGLNEIMRLGTALGGKPETFMGLSGLGDLILTCTDDQSRNRRLGLAIGRGADIQTAEREIGQVVEGKRNAELVALIAKKHQIKMPICETVWQILQGQLSAEQAVERLLNA